MLQLDFGGKMIRALSRPLFYLSAAIASFYIAVNTGCVSGGFHLTRKYAKFVNSKNIILRIVLYIFTGVVFAITLLIDAVVFNTIDFWKGTVSAGNYEYQQGDKKFYAHHEISPEGLKRSTIVVRDLVGKQIQEVILAETNLKEIEMYVDGQLRTRVTDVETLPIAKVYDPAGNILDERMLLPDGEVSFKVASP